MLYPGRALYRRRSTAAYPPASGGRRRSSGDAACYTAANVWRDIAALPLSDSLVRLPQTLTLPASPTAFNGRSLPHSGELLLRCDHHFVPSRTFSFLLHQPAIALSGGSPPRAVNFETFLSKMLDHLRWTW